MYASSGSPISIHGLQEEVPIKSNVKCLTKFNKLTPSPRDQIDKVL